VSEFELETEQLSKKWKQFEAKRNEYKEEVQQFQNKVVEMNKRENELL